MRPRKTQWSKRGGGLVLDPDDTMAAGPLGSVPDVSYLKRCIVGDDQGNDGACVIFAYASAAEIIYGKPISDAACTAIYKRVLKDKGRPAGSGMTFGEGWPYAAPWFPGTKGIRQVGIDAIIRGPLLGGYAVTPAFDRCNADGCMDHKTRGPSRGGHAVVIAAVGVVNTFASLGRCVYIENSWGKRWGKNGIGVMTEALHRTLCQQIWEVVR